MSTVDALAFCRRLDHDETFRAEVQTVRTADQFWALVTRHGYEFTRDEFVQAEQDLLPAEPMDLSMPVTPDLTDPDGAW